MKFHRQHPRSFRPVTGRRLSAARRALQREKESVGLFPELQPTETPEQRIARLDAYAKNTCNACETAPRQCGAGFVAPSEH